MLIDLTQRFSIPVLAPPRSAYFVCYSYRFRRLFYSNISALGSGHHRIFHHDSSSKRTYIFHSKCIEVCETWIKIVYIYRGIWCHTRMERTSNKLIIWIRCVNKERHAKYAERGGGVRGLELRTSDLACYTLNMFICPSIWPVVSNSPFTFKNDD